jgi:hypothetical protein
MQTIETNKPSVIDWVNSLSNLNRYLGENWQGHGPLCSEPKFIARQTSKRELTKQAMVKWEAWLKSDEYRKARQDRLNEAVKAQQAQKKATLKAQSAEARNQLSSRSDYQAEFTAYMVKCCKSPVSYGHGPIATANKLELARFQSYHTDADYTALYIHNLVNWCARRQKELAERRGLHLGDMAIDFGRSKLTYALARLLGNGWSRVYRMRLRANDRIAKHNASLPEGKRKASQWSLPYLATRIFRRGIEQGKGIGKSLDASWSQEDEHAEISGYNLQLAGMDSALRDMKARQLVLARRMLLSTATSTKSNNASIASQRRAARLGWLLANGARLNDQIAIDAGYKSLSLALHSLGRGVAKGSLTRYGESCNDEPNHVEFRNQTMFAEVEPEYKKENDIADSFDFAHLDLNPRNSRLRRKFAGRKPADESAKLRQWFDDRLPLNAAPSKRVTAHLPKPIKPAKLKPTYNQWNESSLLAEWFLARLPINR